jgi:hypothetical protein
MDILHAKKWDEVFCLLEGELLKEKRRKKGGKEEANLSNF